MLTGASLSQEEATEAGILNFTPTQEGWVLTRDAEEYVKAIALVWGKVFSEKAVDPISVAAFLEQYCREVRWDWSLATPPTWKSIKRYLNKLANCAPGIDGIPNAAWQGGGEFVIAFILQLIDAHMGNLPTPTGINDGLFVFLPKGNVDNDSRQDKKVLYRHPTELRPLTLKVAENKIVAGVANNSINPVVCATASKLQRGFVNGRQLMQNTVDLDADSRVQAHKFAAKEYFRFREELGLQHRGLIKMIPILVLFDFAAAFPSISHAWLRAVLVAVNIPRGLLNLFNKLYSKNEAYMCSHGCIKWLFTVLSGVLQGCPFSGSLFVIAMDPLLHMFKTHIESQGLGLIRACADDIGASLSRLDALCILHKLFCQFQVVSGLTLKAKKCILILTSVHKSVNNIAFIKAWFHSFLPDWKDFEIVDKGKYLGVYLGPLSGSIQWQAAIAKFQARIHEIYSLSLPKGLAVARYTGRAVAVLGYVAQIVHPPPHIKKIELAAAGKVLGLCTNALTASTLFAMEAMGGFKLVQPSVMMTASMIRAATKTLSDYDEWHEAISKAALEGLPLASASSGDIVPTGWDSNAFCSNLHQASRGILQGWPDPETVAGVVNLVDQYRNGSLKGSCQGRMYKYLHSRIDPDWSDLLNRRAAVTCIHSVYSTLNPFQLSETFEAEYSRICKKCSKTVNMCIIKSWSNSWYTSSRLHESPVLPCIFGCEGQVDALDHYIVCSPFWTSLSSVVRAPECQAQECPTSRMNLVNPSVIKAKVMAVAFHCYHGLKIARREMVDQAVSSGEYEPITDCLCELARHFCRELM